MRVDLTLAMICGLAACSVGPNFVPPKPLAVRWHDPSVQHAAAVTEASNPDPNWWRGFDDPILSDLITAAIAGNPDLQESLLRVVEAHQNEVSARAAGLPTLDANGSFIRSQDGYKSLADSLGVPKLLNQLASPTSQFNQLSPGLGSQSSATLTQLLGELEAPVNVYQYGFSSSWELDLFGRVRRSVEQAHATTQAEAEAANDALVMLEAQVAQQYLQLRGAQNLTLAQQQNIAAAQASVTLTLQRQQLGLASDVDVDQAQTELLSQETQLPAYEKQAEQAIDALNMLTGQPPGALDGLLAAPAPLPAPPLLVGVGLPSTLARRRPDIREAEDELHAATAGVGVAVADFYPDISLMGSIGERSYVTANLLTSWAGLFYSAGPSISLPIFEGGRLTAQLRLAHARQAEAALNYRSTVLNALREVEDALVAYRTDALASARTAATVTSAGDSFNLAKTRYALGLSSYLQVLDAQRTLVAAQQQLVGAGVTLASDIVTLYTALGGGWQLGPNALPATPVVAPLPILPSALDAAAAH